jgi:hypothetical protein
MTEKLIPHPEIERREREVKLEALEALEAELVERELTLVGIRSELREFENRYLKTVGRSYLELEEVEREMAELMGAQAEDESGAGNWAIEEEQGCGQTRFHASERLKKIYREVARCFHPDLANDTEERERRHRLMIEVNRAYELGAEDRLQELLDSRRAENGEGGWVDLSTEVVLLGRRIKEARDRLFETERMIEELTATEIYRLKLRADRAEAAGSDLLAELVAQVDLQIAKAKNRLFHLRLAHQPEA